MSLRPANSSADQEIEYLPIIEEEISKNILE